LLPEQRVSHDHWPAVFVQDGDRSASQANTQAAFEFVKANDFRQSTMGHLKSPVEYWYCRDMRRVAATSKIRANEKQQTGWRLQDERRSDRQFFKEAPPT
jgi:hypothetical protein